MADCVCHSSQILYGLNIYSVSQDSLSQSPEENLKNVESAILQETYNSAENVYESPRITSGKEERRCLYPLPLRVRSQFFSDIYEAQGQLDTCPANSPQEIDLSSKKRPTELSKAENKSDINESTILSVDKEGIQTSDHTLQKLKDLTSKINKNVEFSDCILGKKCVVFNNDPIVYTVRYEKVKSKNEHIARVIKGNKVWSSTSSNSSKWETLWTPQSFLYRTSSHYSYNVANAAGKPQSESNFSDSNSNGKSSILKDPNHRGSKGSSKRVSFKRSTHNVETPKRVRIENRDICYAIIIAAVVVLVTTAILLL